jgi:hypothetical protein
MRRLWWIPIAVVALLVPVVVLAGSGEGSFDSVVHSIENRYHVQATRIPFMGVVSAIAQAASQNGVGNMRVAEFESFTGPVDGDELNRLVVEKLGAGWTRMIRETSRGGKEQTLIFAHPEGDRMGLFVVDIDGKELDVVELSVDPRHLKDSIDHYEHHQDEGNARGEESD